MDNKLITVKEAADYLQLHQFTILDYIKNGANVGLGKVKLKASKFGRTWRIRIEDLEAFIKAAQIK